MKAKIQDSVCLISCPYFSNIKVGSYSCKNCPQHEQIETEFIVHCKKEKENMLKYGKRSTQVLSNAHSDIQKVFNMALGVGLMDITVIESIRSKEKQTEYFDNGKSKVEWPNGKHNVQNVGDKARAVDAGPYINGTISWKKEHCIGMAYIVLTCAKMLNIDIRWGGNWDQDLEPITDQDFQDLVHFELT